MTRLTKKNEISNPTLPRRVKNIGGKSLRHSRTLLLSAAKVQKRLERSTRLNTNPDLLLATFNGISVNTVIEMACWI